MVARDRLRMKEMGEMGNFVLFSLSFNEWNLKTMLILTGHILAIME